MFGFLWVWQNHGGAVILLKLQSVAFAKIAVDDRNSNNPTANLNMCRVFYDVFCERISPDLSLPWIRFLRQIRFMVQSQVERWRRRHKFINLDS
jgi:hypothetical protein